MSWTLAYAHDQNGAQSAGSLDTLILAIRNGLEVRIMIEFDRVPGQEYYTQVENIHIREKTVYAQCVSHISVIFKDELMVFNDDTFHWFINVDTQGNIDMIRWLVGEHTPRGHTQERVSVKWFVG
jgi:hypothetical protein